MATLAGGDGHKCSDRACEVPPIAPGRRELFRGLLTLRDLPREGLGTLQVGASVPFVKGREKIKKNNDYPFGAHPPAVVVVAI